MSGLATNPEETEGIESAPLSRTESAYQTPADSSGSNVIVDPVEEQQHVMVLGAARSLKSMVNDWVVFLQRENGAEVTLSGEVTIKLDAPDGRKEYTITLLNNDDDASKLDMCIERDPDYPGPMANGMDTHKRSRIAENTENEQNGTKRARVDQSAGTGIGATNPFRAELDNLSSQIRWVEECRRTYDNHHHQREENWRTSTATFHDNMRIQREGHEHWMVQEMMWQRNVLTQIMSDVGNGDTAPIMRWETPSHLSVDPTPPPPPPLGPTAVRPFEPVHFTPASATKKKPKPMPIPSLSKTTPTSNKKG
jgi:hypothetical protein